MIPHTNILSITNLVDVKFTVNPLFLEDATDATDATASSNDLPYGASNASSSRQPPSTPATIGEGGSQSGEEDWASVCSEIVASSDPIDAEGKAEDAMDVDSEGEVERDYYRWLLFARPAN